MAFRLYVNKCGVSHRFSYGRFYNKLDIGMPNILYQFEMLLPLPALLNSIFWVLEALERIVIILEFMLPENKTNGFFNTATYKEVRLVHCVQDGPVMGFQK